MPNEIARKIALKLQPQLIELIWFELIWAGKITEILPVPASADELVGQINSINDSTDSVFKNDVIKILRPIRNTATKLALTSGNEAAILRTLYAAIVLYSVNVHNNNDIDDFKNNCMQVINKAQEELPPDYLKNPLIFQMLNKSSVQ